MTQRPYTPMMDWQKRGREELLQRATAMYQMSKIGLADALYQKVEFKRDEEKRTCVS